MTLDPTPSPLVDPRDLLRSSLRHLEAVQIGQRHWALAEAHRAVAAAYRELGATDMALSNLATARRWARAMGASDQDIDMACLMVETLAGASDAAERRARGDGRRSRDQARDLVFEVTALVPRSADPQWEITVLLRLSDVLDRFGDRDDATQLQIRALQLTVGDQPTSMVRGLELPSARAH